MSWQAVQWVLDNRSDNLVGQPALLLLALADRCAPGSAECHPGHADLMHRLQVTTTQSIRNHLSVLYAAGELQTLGENTGKPTVYILTKYAQHLAETPQGLPKAPPKVSVPESGLTPQGLTPQTPQGLPTAPPKVSVPTPQGTPQGFSAPIITVEQKNKRNEVEQAFTAPPSASSVAGRSRFPKDPAEAIQQAMGRAPDDFVIEKFWALLASDLLMFNGKVCANFGAYVMTEYLSLTRRQAEKKSAARNGFTLKDAGVGINDPGHHLKRPPTRDRQLTPNP